MTRKTAPEPAPGRKTVHVAAESAPVRASLKATLTLYAVADVVETSAEGARGLAAVEASAPDILVVSTEPGKDAAARAAGYRRAAPDAYLIGLAFSEAQAEAFREGGVDAVARSNIGRAGFVALLRRAHERTEPPPETE